MVLFLIPAPMIITKDLRAIARARLRDAQALLRAKRFDGAFYLCGYAVELALKSADLPDAQMVRLPEELARFSGSSVAQDPQSGSPSQAFMHRRSSHREAP